MCGYYYLRQTLSPLWFCNIKCFRSFGSRSQLWNMLALVFTSAPTKINLLQQGQGSRLQCNKCDHDRRPVTRFCLQKEPKDAQGHIQYEILKNVYAA